MIFFSSAALQRAFGYSGDQRDEPVARCTAEGEGGVGGRLHQAQQTLFALRGQSSRYRNIG